MIACCGSVLFFGFIAYGYLVIVFEFRATFRKFIIILCECLCLCSIRIMLGSVILFVPCSGVRLGRGNCVVFVADKFINEDKGVIEVIPTSAQWFGVTYKEDAPEVKQKLDELVDKGEYPNNLWA